MTVILCNNEALRNEIQTKSIVRDNFGNIKAQIIFIQDGENFYIGLEVMDDPLYQFENFQAYCQNPANQSPFPIPVEPVVPPDNTGFTNVPVTDNIKYSLENFINLGSVSKSTTLSEAYLIEKLNGEVFFTLIYRNTGEVMVVNAQTNAAYYINTIFVKPWKPIYHYWTNSIIFIVSTSADVFRFSMTTNTLEFNSGPTAITTGSAMQDRCIGTDLNVYIGAQDGGRVFKYDPVVDIITTYPPIDTDKETIVNNVGGDANFIYAILRNNGNYILSVLNQTTLESVNYKLYSDGYKLGEVLLYREISSGEIFWQARLMNSATNPEFLIKFRDGIEVNFAADVLITPEFGGSLSSSNSSDTWPEKFGWQVDLSRIEGINSPSVFLYKRVDEPSFRELIFNQVQGEDFLTQVFEPMVNGNIVGIGAQYGPVYIINTATDTLQQIQSLNKQSSYSAKDDNGTVYLGGYVDSTYRWNPSQPWNFGTNPFKIGVSAQNSYYHRAYAKFGDWLYIMQEITRNDTGGAIGMYNVVTGQVINVSSSLRTLLKPWNVGDLIRVGTYLVYIANPQSGASVQPEIFIWNLLTDHNINNTIPTQITVNVDKIGGGKAFAISPTEFVALSADVVYRCNVISNSITYYNIPGSITNSRGLTQKPNRHILFISGEYLYELNPFAVSIQRLSSFLGTNKNRCMVYANGNLYLIDGDSTAYSLGDKFTIEKLIL